MIEAELVQDRGMQVIDVYSINGSMVTDFIGLAITRPPLIPPPASETSVANGQNVEPTDRSIQGH